jgi:hypothetical protein
VRHLYTQSEIEKPYLDRRVEGEWYMASLDDSSDDAAATKPPCRVRISEPTAGELPYSVEFRCPGSKDSSGESYSKYDVQLVSIDTNTFFDARFAESEEEGKHLSLRDIKDTGIAPAHLLGRAWVQQDFVRFGPVASDWVEKNWPGDFLAISKVGTFLPTRLRICATCSCKMPVRLMRSVSRSIFAVHEPIAMPEPSEISLLARPITETF